MNINFTIFSNIFIPLIAGMFFFLYFLYFIIANPSQKTSYRYFVIFLISFSIFLVGRSLQTFIGPHPLPLIIVNIRIFFLCSVILPVVILTENVFKRRTVRYKEIIKIGICVFLGLT